VQTVEPDKALRQNHNQADVEELIQKIREGAFFLGVEGEIVLDFEQVLGEMHRKNHCCDDPHGGLPPEWKEKQYCEKSDDADVFPHPCPTFVFAVDEVIGLEYKISQEVSQDELQDDHFELKN
jgi:hypothetical protein